MITREELTLLINGFDKDADGKLTRRGLWGWLTRKEKGEYDLYQSRYGETLVGSHRDVIDVLNTQAQHDLEAVATMVDTATPSEDLKTAFD